MTLLLFESASRFSLFSILAIFVLGVLLGAATLAGIYRSLNSQASLDLAFGPAPARFWGSVSGVTLAVFLWKCCSLFSIGRVFGVRYWPRHYSAGGYARYALALSAWGALSFWAASERGLSGRLDRWRPAASLRTWPKQWLAGALAGLGLAWAGIYSHRWLLLGNALCRAGFNALGWGSTVIPLLLFPIASAFWIWLLKPLWAAPKISGGMDAPWERHDFDSTDLNASARAALALAFILLWSLPSHWTEAYLRANWGYGQADLVSAAGIDPSLAARKIAVIVLSDKRGFPGWQRRNMELEAAGIDASPRNLGALRRYMDSRAWRSLFAAQALEALRKGWALNWEPENYMDAALFGLGDRLPPDFAGFLAAVRAAPATLENYQRLERAAALASRIHLIRVDLTQKLYEGFSAAYAHFGETRESNAWLEKIQGLWPLYSENIHMEPVEQDLNCSISGGVFVNGHPLRSLKVGLFLVRSTATAVEAYEGLVDSTYPDWRGRFEFSHLTPGRYYLALQGDIERAAGGLALYAPPGVVHLSAERAELEVPPIAFIKPLAAVTPRSKRRGPVRGSKNTSRVRKRRRRA